VLLDLMTTRLNKYYSYYYYFEKLTGEDLSRYLNKIESIGLRKG